MNIKKNLIKDTLAWLDEINGKIIDRIFEIYSTMNSKNECKCLCDSIYHHYLPEKKTKKKLNSRKLKEVNKKR